MENTENYQAKTLAEANQFILFLQEKISTIEQQYANLQYQISSLFRNRYGKSSEKLPEGMTQLNLLPKPEVPKDAIREDAEETETITYTRKEHNNRTPRGGYQLEVEVIAGK